MCFILVLTRAHDRYPLIVAANRDESRTRPTTPPHRWPGEPSIVAGRDTLAGGTWLGVNALGLLAAITNRREEAAGEGDPANYPAPTEAARRRVPTDPSLPSRGGLCLGALHEPSLEAAAAYAESELRRSKWNPFNLLCATVEGAWVKNWREETWALQPGAHVVTNEGDPDHLAFPMVKRGRELIAALDYRSMPLDALFLSLEAICRDTEGPHPICRPGGERGTVSSSLIALDSAGRLAAYWHADGPPCQFPYVPVDLTQ